MDTGLVDTNGQKICFSVAGRDGGRDCESIELESETIRSVTLVNGVWKRYSKILVASGTENETFVLDGIASDSDAGKYIADGYVNVYVKRDGKFQGGSQYTLDQEEILVNTSQQNGIDSIANRVYGPTSKVFSARLNEDKVYEIKFGDGTTGERLQPGDQVYVFYLETNGLDGEIDVGRVDFENAKFTHTQQMFGLSRQDYSAIFDIGSKTMLTDVPDSYQMFPSSLNTTTPHEEQDVEDIRETAPNWFKTGNRLITRGDYERFVFQSVPQVVDVKCMNNWEYMASFYKWLYDCGMKYHPTASDPGRYYLQESKLQSGGIGMVDAADANNVYLWVKAQSGATLGGIRNMLNANGIDYMKTLTTEVQVVEPVPVIFDICACYQDVALKYSQAGRFQEFVQAAIQQSYLEVTLDDQSVYVNSYIVDQVVAIFARHFLDTNLTIGQNVRSQDILDEIYSIGGVNRVRTVFQPDGTLDLVDAESLAPRAMDGLSFITWSNGYIDYGEDVQVGNVQRHVLDFQAPTFNGDVAQSVRGRVRVIKSQLANVSGVKF